MKSVSGRATAGLGVELSREEGEALVADPFVRAVMRLHTLTPALAESGGIYGHSHDFGW